MQDDLIKLKEKFLKLSDNHTREIENAKKDYQIIKSANAKKHETKIKEIENQYCSDVSLEKKRHSDKLNSIAKSYEKDKEEQTTFYKSKRNTLKDKLNNAIRESNITEEKEYSKAILDYRLQEHLIEHRKTIKLIESLWSPPKYFDVGIDYSKKKEQEEEQYRKITDKHKQLYEKLLISGWKTHTFRQMDKTNNSDSVNDLVAFKNTLNEYDYKYSSVYNSLIKSDNSVKSVGVYDNTIAVAAIVSSVAIIGAVSGIPILLLILVPAMIIISSMSASKREVKQKIETLLTDYNCLEKRWDKLSKSLDSIIAFNNSIIQILDKHDKTLKENGYSKNKPSYIEDNCVVKSNLIENLKMNPSYSNAFISKHLNDDEVEMLPQIIEIHRKNAVTLKEIASTLNKEIEQLELQNKERLERISIHKKKEIGEENNKHKAALFDLESNFDKRKTIIVESHLSDSDQLKSEYESKINQLNEKYKSKRESVVNEVNAIRKSVSDICSYDSNKSDCKDMVSFKIADVVVKASKDKLVFPFFYSLVDYRPLIIYSPAKEKKTAISLAKSIILQGFYKIPAGKCYCLFFDPIDLGKSFSEFMDLADYDDKLVYTRIWTETDLLNRLLKEQKQMMENTIQFTLRKSYQSIEEYNDDYGGIQEPYRFLVIADFPAGFDSGYRDESLRVLQSLMRNGPHCGFHTILLVTGELKTDAGIQITDLSDNPLEIHINSTSVKLEGYSDENEKNLFIISDPKTYKKVFEHVGNTIKQNVVSVDMLKLLNKIGFNDKDWHKGNATKNISVPIGPAGVHRIQNLEIGDGTKQHVLISGRTGSGKSTLLHTIIFNLIMKYSPSEIQLFLIDFKKGVEFKIYGDKKLPHARVIAIAGESEFGLSVLELLNRQLDERGKLFRSQGVESFQDYKLKTGKQLPRIILIADEFQEFFTSDISNFQDKAREFFDRLIRQGRAFGIHLILGTQTLAGTLSMEIRRQISIRIALSCSDADSEEILSPGNTAAKLLKNPGAAIYNSENGNIEGNHNFQVSYLNDRDKEQILEKVNALQYKSTYKTNDRQYVFEGNAYSNIQHSFTSHDVEEIAAHSRFRFWLGDPISIGDPVSILLSHTRAENILIIGRDISVTEGLLCSMLFTATMQKKWSKKIYILDYSADSSDFENYINSDQGKDASSVCYGRRKELKLYINEIHAELKNRIIVQTSKTNDNSILLVINQLQRIREFDKSFSDNYNRTESPESEMNRKLDEIIKEGPALNIYTLVNVDVYSNLQRRFSRETIPEFENMICFQMSKDDSYALINDNVASTLGPFKAVYFNEGSLTNIKFKPFQMPSLEITTIMNNSSNSSNKSNKHLE